MDDTNFVSKQFLLSFETCRWNAYNHSKTMTDTGMTTKTGKHDTAKSERNKIKLVCIAFEIIFHRIFQEQKHSAFIKNKVDFPICC